MKVSSNRLDRQYKAFEKEYLEKVKEVLDSGWYILGNEVKSFEKEFADYCGSSYCVGLASGLDALIMAFDVLNIKEGDEVIVPANTYIATVMGITKNGATPVFVEPTKYYNLDPEKVEAAITPKTKAICVVHLYGQICDMPAIMEIAKKHNLYVVEDCAQAHGASINGKKVGTYGDIGCFSFYPTKNLGGFGDGGAITTESKEIAEQMKMLRNYGSRVTYYFETVGYNSRLDELQAGMLRVKLQHLDKLNQERLALAKKYIQGITNPKIKLPEFQFGDEGHIFHLFVIETENRDELIEYLKKHDIEIKIHYPQPPHLAEAYKELGFKVGDFPITEHMADHVLSLPIYNEMTEEEINYVIDVINQY